jgi:hypothetical protein
MIDDKRYIQTSEKITVTRTTKGAGRWTSCKDCYKNVQPFIFTEDWEVGWQRLLCCSECGSGLRIINRVGLAHGLG